MMRTTFGLTMLLVAAALAPVAAADPLPVAANSCTTNDSLGNTCAFACIEGDTVTVSGTNANEWYSQTFSADCGGTTASCTAPKGQSCRATSAEKASAAGEGLCSMESDGEGSVTCASGGGTAPSCTSDPVACLCPPAICGAVPDPGDLVPPVSVPADLLCDQIPEFLAHCTQAVEEAEAARERAWDDQG